MYKTLFKIPLALLLIQSQTFAMNFESFQKYAQTKKEHAYNKFSNKSGTTTADRAQYIKSLYYSVNGYPDNYDTTNLADPHLNLFNNILGENGVGGILYSAGYTSCDTIPSSGTASGTSPQVGTLNLTFGSATKSVPSYYTTNGGDAMDKNMTVSGNASVTVTVELKCHDDSALQTGYVKLNFTEYSVVYEGYFQQNTTTGAVNLDMYIKTQTGGGTDILIPTQFVTTDGQNYKIYSAYLGLSGGGGVVDYLVAVNGVTNGKAQIAYLNTTDTSGSALTTAPNNFGSLTSAGGTTVAVECIDMSNETTTTGCSAIDAPGSLTIGGTTSTWTLSSLKSVSL
ncbi:hypothetical protein HBN50_12905 [Halobacteriovorax sp. GB3]|uniref:hypothetical protein n=1 Tax=Halobacteriovorax sp. GB3 TaxID=2719615 RepID=UPI00235DC666|nr:hypothetical protein [Halobacteriovorax sp. GB3]MDD0854004.1 hypothetical protein [Halobacteriovorax sp. GB3]